MLLAHRKTKKVNISYITDCYERIHVDEFDCVR
jgi:hypothetical protein